MYNAYHTPLRLVITKGTHELSALAARQGGIIIDDTLEL
jgi:hypothetical protein